MTSGRPVEHPALLPGAGRSPEEALLTDQQRVAVLLQAAAILSHLRLANRRLEAGWKHARIDEQGMLGGLTSVAGPNTPAQALLRDLAGRLFLADETVAGRGSARRSVRRLMALWGQDLQPIAPDEAVTEILDEASFLWLPVFGRVRQRLAAVHGELPETRLWVAGPGRFRGALLARAPSLGELEALLSSAEAERIWRSGRGDLDGPVAASGWRSAAAARRGRVDRSSVQRLDLARLLFGLARFDSCLEELKRLRSPAARVLRARCFHRLGRLRAARRELEKLMREKLDADQLLDAGDVAVRLYGNLGMPDRAREWVTRLIDELAGKVPAPRAELVACAAAWDRGDDSSMSRHLERASALRNDRTWAWQWHKAAGQAALSRDSGSEAVAAFGRALSEGRKQMSPLEAGDLWNEMALGRSSSGDLAGAERALRHTLRLHREAEGPRRTTLALFNLAEIRLRRGRLEGVAEIVRRSMRENRQAGNWRGLIHDLELRVRFELVRGRPSAALEQAEEALAQAAEHCDGWRAAQIHGLAARALGWLDRPEDAAAELEEAGPEAAADLESEERPALLALAGHREAALQAVAPGPAAAVWRAVLTRADVGEQQWEQAAALEPYRFARLVFDLEAIDPGWAPPMLVRRAATTLRRVGAGRLAERLEDGARAGWLPVAEHLEAGHEGTEAICRLLEDVGAGELGLWRRSTVTGETETLVAGGAGKAELRTRVGNDELCLTASWIDPLVRVLFQLVVRSFGRRHGPTTASVPSTTGIVGESPALQAALSRLALLAPEPVPILICGETGTGKELAARRVHQSSMRSGEVFVPFNCAAVSEDLLMSDLFGHVRGAFTGATRDRSGIFETARGGTVLLDEIGDLPLRAQGFLLRVLQEGEVRRVGETLPRSADVRVVAASHRDLEAMVRQGAFRADLFYRLRVASIELPPLRDRGDDVILLAEHFLRLLRPAATPELSPAARAALLGYDWPGNVRELENTLAVAVALAEGGTVRPEHLDLRRAGSEDRIGYHEKVLNFRRRLVQEALAVSGGNLAAAARRMGVSRQALSYLVRKLGIDR